MWKITFSLIIVTIFVKTPGHYLQETFTGYFFANCPLPHYFKRKSQEHFHYHATLIRNNVSGRFLHTLIGIKHIYTYNTSPEILSNLENFPIDVHVKILTRKWKFRDQ